MATVAAVAFPAPLASPGTSMDEEGGIRDENVISRSVPGDQIDGDGDWRRQVLFHSLGLAAMIPVVLWRSGGEPVLIVCSLSLLLAAYFFRCACILLSAAPRCRACDDGVLSAVATPRTILFLVLSYCALLAFFVDVLLSRMLGMVIIYLESVLAAGCFGSAFAERTGAHKAAAIAVAKIPIPANEEQKEAVLARKFTLRFILGLFTLVGAARVAWVVCPRAGYSPVHVAANLSGVLAYLLFLYMISAVRLLHGVLLGEESDLRIVLWFAVISMLTLSACAVLGELAATIVLWLCVVASTVFLGYCLHFYAACNQIIRSQDPATVLEEEDLDCKVRQGVQGFGDTTASGEGNVEI